MRNFNYSEIRNQKWDSDILGFIVAIYKEADQPPSCYCVKLYTFHYPETAAMHYGK